VTTLTVVVPTYNEAENVGALVHQLDVQLEGVDAEILFVDDSTDRTPDIIRNLAKASRVPIRLLHRDHPEGHLAGAVIAGLKASESTWAVVMDGDLQHPPATVPVLYNHGRLSGADVVVASRYIQGGSLDGHEGPFRRLASLAFGRAAKALFPRRLAGCSDPTTGFFLVRRDALRLDSITQCGMHVLLPLLLHRKLAVTEVPFCFAERHAGESKASLKEGLRFLKVLAVLRAGPGVRFALVGASGVIPNLAAVAILTAFRIHYLIAAAIATQIAIAWNFVGAELIVFRDRRPGKLWQRGLQFAIVSETDLIRLPFVALLVHQDLNAVAATAITLLVALALRFGLVSRFVYTKPVNQKPTIQTDLVVEELAA
jgi:dolichol-phosphate mannosyltransferase